MSCGEKNLREILSHVKLSLLFPPAFCYTTGQVQWQRDSPSYLVRMHTVREPMLMKQQTIHGHWVPITVTLTRLGVGECSVAKGSYRCKQVICDFFLIFFLSENWEWMESLPLWHIWGTEPRSAHSPLPRVLLRSAHLYKAFWYKYN